MAGLGRTELAFGEVMEPLELEAEIRAAFASRGYPGDDGIVRRQPGCEGSEAEETWEVFRGKSWQDILPIGRMRLIREDITWFTAEGFAYYLPAFLILSLDQAYEYAPDDSLVYRLWTRPEEISPLLAPAEKRAVIETLKFLSSEYEKFEGAFNNAYTALEHYWAYFTNEELGLKPNVQE